jgi:hypothetical protein
MKEIPTIEDMAKKSADENGYENSIIGRQYYEHGFIKGAEWASAPDGEHWKKRCEAAEAAYIAAKEWWEKELSLEGYEKLSKSYDDWQQLKSQEPR